MATSAHGTSFCIEINGKDIAGDINVEQTGAWDNWEITEENNIYLNRGNQFIRFICATGGYNLDWFEVVLPRSKKAPERMENLNMHLGKP